jgi:hypothetical protein
MHRNELVQPLHVLLRSTIAAAGTVICARGHLDHQNHQQNHRRRTKAATHLARIIAKTSPGKPSTIATQLLRGKQRHTAPSPPACSVLPPQPATPSKPSVEKMQSLI